MKLPLEGFQSISGNFVIVLLEHIYSFNEFFSSYHSSDFTLYEVDVLMSSRVLLLEDMTSRVNFPLERIEFAGEAYCSRVTEPAYCIMKKHLSTYLFA